MQIGQTIEGKISSYRLDKSLGTPGLYGQAFLATSSAGDQVVIKVLTPTAPSDGPEVLAREAETLQRVADVEKSNNCQYAVRFIDSSKAEPIKFIAMELATGKNVVADLMHKVVDWDRLPLEEATVLDIAWHFATALRMTHKAGLTYDDMKLENLFWDGKNLRIIDWNVVSPIDKRANAIAGDWARFGARLYELYTGQAVALDRNAKIIGSGPGGARWENLPSGIRTIIRKALALGYESDESLQNDLKQERRNFFAAQNGDWAELLQQARVSDTRNDQPEQTMALLDRAERCIKAQGHLNSDHTKALEDIQELRRRAQQMLGYAPEEQLQTAFQRLQQGDYPSAKDRFLRMIATAFLDPQPRRGLWMTQIALSNGAFFRNTQEDMFAALRFMREGKFKFALSRLTAHNSEFAESAEYRWLVQEMEARIAESTNLDEAIKKLDGLLEALRQQQSWTDLETYRTQLVVLRDQIRERETYVAEQQQLQQKFDTQLQAARQAEVKQDIHEAIAHYHIASITLREIDGSDPDLLKWINYHTHQIAHYQSVREFDTWIAGMQRDEIPFRDILNESVQKLPELNRLFMLIRARVDDAEQKIQTAPTLSTLQAVINGFGEKLQELSDQIQTGVDKVIDNQSELHTTTDGLVREQTASLPELSASVTTLRTSVTGLGDGLGKVYELLTGDKGVSTLHDFVVNNPTTQEVIDEVAKLQSNLSLLQNLPQSLQGAAAQITQLQEGVASLPAKIEAEHGNISAAFSLQIKQLDAQLTTISRNTSTVEEQTKLLQHLPQSLQGAAAQITQLQEGVASLPAKIETERNNISAAFSPQIAQLDAQLTTILRNTSTVEEQTKDIASIKTTIERVSSVTSNLTEIINQITALSGQLTPLKDELDQKVKDLSSEVRSIGAVEKNLTATITTQAAETRTMLTNHANTTISATVTISSIRQLIQQGLLKQADAKLQEMSALFSGIDSSELNNQIAERRKAIQQSLKQLDLNGQNFAQLVKVILRFEKDKSEHYNAIHEACHKHYPVISAPPSTLESSMQLQMYLTNFKQVCECLRDAQAALGEDNPISRFIAGKLTEYRSIHSITTLLSKLHQPDKEQRKQVLEYIRKLSSGFDRTALPVNLVKLLENLKIQIGGK